MKNKRKIVLIVLLTAIGVSISMVFWWQDIQYSLPTPLPEDYKEVALGTQLSIGAFFDDGQPKLLHFYNPSCPCSKFNEIHIKELYAKYGNKISFFVVTEKDDEQVREKFGFQIIQDMCGNLADACGVYATPQAVVLDRENKIYYRGNYNKERYCTAKNTNFAEVAIKNILAGDQRKEFSVLATRSYGCQLLSDIKK